MDSIFMRRLTRPSLPSYSPNPGIGSQNVFPPNGKATSLREEFDMLKNGFWQLRCFLLDSCDLDTKENDEFVMSKDNHVLHELMLLLDLAAFDFTAFDQVGIEFRQRYVELR